MFAGKETTKIKIESSFTQQKWEGEVELNPGTPEEQLEQIFRLFNRVDEADVQRLEQIGYRMSSLSVGDIVHLHGQMWRVSAVGFSKM